MKLSEYIQHMRSFRDMSRQSLADACQVTVRTVQRWEAGKSQPSLWDAGRLSRALRVPVARIVERADR